MGAIAKIMAGLAVTAFLGLAVSLGLSPGAADAGYGVVPEPVVQSHPTAKSDQVAVRRRALVKAVEVAEIRQEGDDFVLIDSRGREVYRSDGTSRTTTVEKNIDVPLVTGLGVATTQVSGLLD